MLLEFVYRVEKWRLWGYKFQARSKNKKKSRIELHEPHLIPRLDSPVVKVEGGLLMKLRVPSLEIKSLGGFGLPDEKGLSVFGMLMKGSGDSIMMNTFNWREARRVAVTWPEQEQEVSRPQVAGRRCSPRGLSQCGTSTRRILKSSKPSMGYNTVINIG